MELITAILYQWISQIANIREYQKYKEHICRGQADNDQYFLSLHINRGKAKVDVSRKILGQYKWGL